MDKIELEIDRAEVLRYLGYRGGDIDGQVMYQLDLAREKVLTSGIPRSMYAIYPLERNGGLILSGTVFALEGRDIERHLTGCNRVILMSATLGEGIQAEIRRAQVTDMALAAIIDATADTAVEAVCDLLQAELERELAGKYLTERFSPGYGDMPLSQQGPLCQVLDTARKIGVTVTGNFLLSPCKSVTALIGISDSPIEHSGRGCDSCNLALSCEFRKAGKTCAK